MAALAQAAASLAKRDDTILSAAIGTGDEDMSARRLERRMHTKFNIVIYCFELKLNCIFVVQSHNFFPVENNCLCCHWVPQGMGIELCIGIFAHTSLHIYL